MRTKKTKRKTEEKVIQTETQPTKTNTCMNTYGNCTKEPIPIVYASREGKEFITNHFCSKECLDMYKYQGRGSKKVRELARKVYNKQATEYKKWKEENGEEIYKPTVWIDKDTGKEHDCSFKIKKEKLKNKIKFKGVTYILDKTGKYPEYKVMEEKIKEGTPIYTFDKKVKPIDPNRVNKKLLIESEAKLFKGWLTKSLVKWKKMPYNSLENYLYRLYKKNDEEGIIKRVPNCPVRTKTGDGIEKTDRNFWKTDYILMLSHDLAKDRFPTEIGYYLLIETYQELNSNGEVVKKEENGGTKNEMPKMQRRGIPNQTGKRIQKEDRKVRKK